jgi:hypothetical protein
MEQRLRSGTPLINNANCAGSLNATSANKSYTPSSSITNVGTPCLWQTFSLNTLFNQIIG